MLRNWENRTSSIIHSISQSLKWFYFLLEKGVIESKVLLYSHWIQFISFFLIVFLFLCFLQWFIIVDLQVMSQWFVWSSAMKIYCVTPHIHQLISVSDINKSKWWKTKVKKSVNIRINTTKTLSNRWKTKSLSKRRKINWFVLLMIFCSCFTSFLLLFENSELTEW